MKNLFALLLLTASTPVLADLSHSITSSTKLTVGGASTTSSRLGNSYSISGSGVDTSYTTAAGTTVSDGLGSLNVTSIAGGTAGDLAGTVTSAGAVTLTAGGHNTEALGQITSTLVVD